MEERIDGILEQLSLAEKVGQMVQAEIHQATVADVKKYHLGSVLNGGGSYPNKDKQASITDWVNLADQFWLASTDDSDGRVGIPILWGTDAVHGHNNVPGATLFPHNIGLGATRDPELIERIGEVTAKEVTATGIDWTFAPTLAVVRDDRWGRSYEGYAESPELVAEFTASMVKGLQGSLQNGRIIATAKHFIGDGGTDKGKDQGNTMVDESVLRDLHGSGYFRALEAGVQSVMVSFNSWNGQKLHGHRYLIQDILKDRLGFDGLVVSDWNGIGQVKGCQNDDCAQAVNAGIDLFMIPYKADWQSFIANTIRQVKAGKIPMARINDAVRRILRVKMRAGLFDKPRPSQRLSAKGSRTVGSRQHRAVAREAVRKSLVLLKNNGALLPLRRQSRIFVAGKSADSEANQTGGWTLSWQGTGNKPEDYVGVTTVLDAVKEVAASVDYNAQGQGVSAKAHDVAIVVIGETPYAEGRGDLGSSDTLELAKLHPEDRQVLERVRGSGVPVVTIYLGGRPLYMNQELNLSDAFVAAWWPGSEGQGITDVIFQSVKGGINYDFTGRLSFSWPQGPCQTPLNIGDKGYNPLFPYGYGLTYAQAGDLGVLLVPTREFGCGQNGAQPIQDDVALLTDGKIGEPWQLFIGDPVLDWAATQVGSRETITPSITVTAIDNAQGLQWAARRVQFEGPGQIYFQHKAGESLNLASFAGKGRLSFLANIEKAVTEPVRLRIDCVYPCGGTLEITDRLNSIVGEGWQPLSFALDQFKGVQWDRVTTPFLLFSEGELSVDLDRVMWQRGKGASALSK
jgi:beta-glucosidase